MAVIIHIRKIKSVFPKITTTWLACDTALHQYVPSEKASYAHPLHSSPRRWEIQDEKSSVGCLRLEIQSSHHPDVASRS